MILKNMCPYHTDVNAVAELDSGEEESEIYQSQLYDLSIVYRLVRVAFDWVGRIEYILVCWSGYSERRRSRRRRPPRSRLPSRRPKT